MVDLTWLRAQLDEDERVARATIHPNHTGEWVFGEHVEWSAYGDRARWELTLDEIAPTIWDTSGIGPSPLRHMARHDPARVLREIEAKRRILDAWDQDGAFWPGGSDVPALLALPYADRPGYREEWRP